MVVVAAVFLSHFKIIISFVMREFFLSTVICCTTSGQFEMLSLGIILSTRIALEQQCMNNVRIQCVLAPQVIGDCHVTHGRKHLLSHSHRLSSLAHSLITFDKCAQYINDHTSIFVINVNQHWCDQSAICLNSIETVTMKRDKEMRWEQEGHSYN